MTPIPVAIAAFVQGWRIACAGASPGAHSTPSLHFSKSIVKSLRTGHFSTRSKELILAGSGRENAAKCAMRIIRVTSLALEGVFVVQFRRFCDARGYFTESFRRSILDTHPEISFLRGVSFVQGNESFSRKGVLRGLHFQWNPYMGKLVRTVHGRMVDIVLDVRRGSPTFGHAILHDMPSSHEADIGEWIWVPPGFAHGNFFTEDSRIEYLCSGEYSPGCEAGISPLSADIDWSVCDPALKEGFDKLVGDTPIMTDKDRDGLSVRVWAADQRSENFVYGRL